MPSASRPSSRRSPPTPSLTYLSRPQEASTFLKKRAQIEEEYARSMAKLARSSIENYSVGDGKAGCVAFSARRFCIVPL